MQSSIVIFLASLHFRGNPSVQGNSVLALAGLARAVSIFVQQQSSSGTTEPYQRNTEWLNMVADTLMVVLDGNYKAKGPTLVWCQQVNNYRLLHELSWSTSALLIMASLSHSNRKECLTKYEAKEGFQLFPGFKFAWIIAFIKSCKQKSVFDRKNKYQSKPSVNQVNHFYGYSMFNRSATGLF